LRFLALVTDAFGGGGGIARYNKDFLSALAAINDVEEIVVLPRLAPDHPGQLPAKLRQLPPIFRRTPYSINALCQSQSLAGYDGIFCGHLMMAPLAALLSRLTKASLWLQVHGIDAWARPSNHVRWGAERADLVTSVSRYTRCQMISRWWNGDPSRIHVLPNTVGDEFRRRPKSDHLIQRYKLNSRKVLLTVSRLTVADRYKGIERVIECLPRIREHHPEALYLITGDGDDAGHLRTLVSQKGLAEHVRFAGRVPDVELADHYNAADAFIMPSTGEGFGIVFLEAAASGIEVIGGKADGSWDALREGTLGQAIDPQNGDAIVDAVCRAFAASKRPSAERAKVFCKENFNTHVAAVAQAFIRDVCGGRRLKGRTN
jgi:phosphatidyl-myo-inositol dimannoside synthase